MDNKEYEKLEKYLEQFNEGFESCECDNHSCADCKYYLQKLELMHNDDPIGGQMDNKELREQEIEKILRDIIWAYNGKPDAPNPEISVEEATEDILDIIKQQKTQMIKSFEKFMFSGGAPDRESLISFLNKLKEQNQI